MDRIGGQPLEWADVSRNLEALRVVTIHSGSANCELRTMPRGVAGKVLAAAGVALVPAVRFLEGE